MQSFAPRGGEPRDVHRLYIEGKWVPTRSLLPDPQRCRGESHGAITSTRLESLELSSLVHELWLSNCVLQLEELETKYLKGFEDINHTGHHITC